MEKRIATIISYLAHPLIIPLIGLLIIGNSGTYAADIDGRYRQFIYLSVFIFTLLLPAALIPLFYYFGLARNVQFTERRERLVPLYITLVFYLAAYFLIRKIPVSVVYQRFLFAGCLSMLSLSVISWFWKISAHMVGWGGLTALILILSVQFNTDLMLFMIVCLLISGLVGFARLKLYAHNTLQIYTGFLLGFAVMFVVFILR
jgi:uncharacterized membrane protein